MARSANGSNKAPKKGTWGGARPGAGRPRTSTRVSHLKRVPVRRGVPCYVTLELAEGLPSFRSRRILPLVQFALAANPGARGKRAVGARMRVVRHRIEPQRLHLLVEATNTEALARGMQGLSIRLAKRLNAELDRTGRVFADRFRSHALRSPEEVRRLVASLSKS